MRRTVQKSRLALAYLLSFLVMQGIEPTNAISEPSGTVREGQNLKRKLSGEQRMDETNLRTAHRFNLIPRPADRPRPMSQSNPGGQATQREELAQQRELWNSWNMTYYKQVSQRSCFCTEDMRAQTLIAVDAANGNVSVINAETRQPMPDDSPAFSFVPTVDHLFDVMMDALDRNAYLIDVEYDETYGFIKRLYVDYDPRIADEEMNIVVHSFLPISQMEIELEANRLKWINTLGAVAGTYRFAFRHVGKNEGNKVITYRHASVVNGEFEAIFGLTAARSGERDALHLYTIPEYFDWIATVLRDDSSYNRLTIQYDPEFGYPTEIAWDQFWMNGNPVVISINQLRVEDSVELPVLSEMGNNSSNELDSFLEVNSFQLRSAATRNYQFANAVSLMVALASARMLL